MNMSVKDKRALTDKHFAWSTVWLLLYDGFKVDVYARNEDIYISATKSGVVPTDAGEKEVTYSLEVPIKGHKLLLEPTKNPALSSIIPLDK